MKLRLKPPYRTLAILCLIIAGCSSTQFFYNRADWLLHYQADHYFNLSKTQKPIARQDIRQWLTWHRRSQLVCYADLIEEFEARANSGLTVADIDWVVDEFVALYEAIVTSAMEPTTQILASLNTKQINHLEKQLAKEQSKLLKELKPGTRRRLENRAKATADNIEKWFGNLSRNQVNWVKASSLELPDLYAPWLEYRAFRNRALIELLRAGTDAQTIAAALEPLWTDPGEAMSAVNPANGTLMDQMQTESHAMAVEFYQLATPKQRAHFWQRMQGYRSDFLQLAGIAQGATCQTPTTQQAEESLRKPIKPLTSRDSIDNSRATIGS